jgi:hypothetical protein
VTAERPGLSTVLHEVRDAVAATRLELEVEGAATRRADRDALVHQLDDYLLPRLRQLDAPLLAVVGGSTGAGKSTLVNSVIGTVVTPSGALRPTTRAPILVCNPADRGWFADDRVLPGLVRTTGDAPGGTDTVHLVTTDALPAGLALLDAPDFDSVVTSNRTLAAQVLAAADLWVFVTTAARYADAVPWDFLTDAGGRGAAVAIVLDRVPPDALEEVTADLRRMLDERDVGTTLLHPVRESELLDGLLPEAEVAPLRDWLRSLAEDADARAAVIRATLDGALDEMERRGDRLVSAVAEQGAIVDALSGEVGAAYDGARHQVDAAVRGGALLRGEVLARWQELLGTGELMRSVQARVTAIRDRAWAMVTGRTAAAVGVVEAVESGVASLIHAAADDAAEGTVTRWRAEPAGRALLGDREQELRRASSHLLEALPDEVRAWQAGVLDLVREEGARKRTGARIASLSVNGAGLVVMLAVFAQTAGITGTELAIAGGTSAVSQKVLEAIFGDQAIRALAERARLDLSERVDRLLPPDAARFHDLLDEADPTAGDDLDTVLDRWRRARSSDDSR